MKYFMIADAVEFAKERDPIALMDKINGEPEDGYNVFKDKAIALKAAADQNAAEDMGNNGGYRVSMFEVQFQGTTGRHQAEFECDNTTKEVLKKGVYSVKPAETNDFRVHKAFLGPDYTTELELEFDLSEESRKKAKAKILAEQAQAKVNERKQELPEGQPAAPAGAATSSDLASSSAPASSSASSDSAAPAIDPDATEDYLSAPQPSAPVIEGQVEIEPLVAPSGPVTAPIDNKDVKTEDKKDRKQNLTGNNPPNNNNNRKGFSWLAVAAAAAISTGLYWTGFTASLLAKFAISASLLPVGITSLALGLTVYGMASYAVARFTKTKQQQYNEDLAQADRDFTQFKSTQEAEQSAPVIDYLESLNAQTQRFTQNGESDVAANQPVHDKLLVRRFENEALKTLKPLRGDEFLKKEAELMQEASDKIQRGSFKAK